MAAPHIFSTLPRCSKAKASQLTLSSCRIIRWLTQHKAMACPFKLLVILLSQVYLPTNRQEKVVGNKSVVGSHNMRQGRKIPFVSDDSQRSVPGLPDKAQEALKRRR